MTSPRSRRRSRRLLLRHRCGGRRGRRPWSTSRTGPTPWSGSTRRGHGRPGRLAGHAPDAPLGAAALRRRGAGRSSSALLDHDRIWTCAKGSYAEPVAEHALTLALAGLRHLPTRIAARSWGIPAGTSLYDQQVTILGGGGITTVAARAARSVPGRGHRGPRQRRSGSRRGPHRAGLRPARGPPRVPGGVPGPGPHPGDDRDHRCARAGPDGRDAPGWSTWPGVATSTPTRWWPPWAPGRSPAPPSTSPIPSRCPTAIRSGTCPTASSRPHTADTIEMVLPLLAERIRTNVARFAAGGAPGRAGGSRRRVLREPDLAGGPSAPVDLGMRSMGRARRTSCHTRGR